MHGPFRVLVYWGPPLLYAGIIFYLSSQSDPLPSVPIWDFDKILHLVEYTGLGVLLCRALFRESRWASPRSALLGAAMLGAIYGLTDEWHQSLVPNREADPMDFLTDACGSLLGSGAYLAVALRWLGAGTTVSANRGDGKDRPP